MRGLIDIRLSAETGTIMHFENSILRETLVVLRKNLGFCVVMVLLSTAVNGLFVLAFSVVAARAPIEAAVLMGLGLAVVFTIPAAFMAFVIQGTVLRGEHGFSGFRTLLNDGGWKFVGRYVILVLISQAFILPFQLFFIHEVGKVSASPNPSDLTFFREMQFAGFLVQMIVSIFEVLILSWVSAAIVPGADQSLKRAFARGRKTFWYVLGRSLGLSFLILIAFLILMIPGIVIGKLGLAWLGQAWLAVSVLAIGMYLISGLFVIGARAFLLGEARLDQGGKAGIEDTKDMQAV